jgi:hypothetical protein
VWIQGDYLLGEHTRRFPHCSFVQQLLQHHKKTLLGADEVKSLALLIYPETTVQRAFNQCKNEGLVQPSCSNIIAVIRRWKETSNNFGSFSSLIPPGHEDEIRQ